MFCRRDIIQADSTRRCPVSGRLYWKCRACRRALWSSEFHGSGQNLRLPIYSNAPNFPTVWAVLGIRLRGCAKSRVRMILTSFHSGIVMDFVFLHLLPYTVAPVAIARSLSAYATLSCSSQTPVLGLLSAPRSIYSLDLTRTPPQHFLYYIYNQNISKGHGKQYS